MIVADLVLCYLSTKKVGPWRIRIDKPHSREAHHQEHVHITRSGLKGEYSWNKDGSRHDKHRFPASEQHISAAKRVAAEALKVQQAALQFITAIDGGCRVSLSEVPGAGRVRSLLSTYVRTGQNLILLGSTDYLVLAVLDQA